MTPTLAPLAYGGMHWATVQALFAEMGVSTDWLLKLRPADAAVDRARSKLLTMLITVDAARSDVLVMVDHDISWVAGDLRHLVDMARETHGLVAGVVAKKAHGLGYGGRLPAGFRGEIRTRRLVKMPPHSYCGGACVAVHADAARAIAANLSLVAEGWYPFCEPMQLNNPAGHIDYLTEDWVLCHRVREAGHSVHTTLWPLVHHTGDYVYSPFDACPEEHVQRCA